MCGRFAVTTDPALLAEKIQAIDEITASAAAAN
jgi:putative SOS response-associated peptidase YedK